MKTIKKQVEIVKYVCEICGREHDTSYYALACEKTCKKPTCKHEKVEFYLNTLPSRCAFVQKECGVCDEVLERINLSWIDEDPICEEIFKRAKHVKEEICHNFDKE